MRTLTGKEIELDVEGSDMVRIHSFRAEKGHKSLAHGPLTQRPTGKQVSKIKELVEVKEGIPPAQQRLIYGGKQM